VSALVFGRDVIIQTHGKDNYVLTFADVFLSDGTHVNHELVKDGSCWWYRKYAPGNVELEKLEKEARSAKKWVVDRSCSDPAVGVSQSEACTTAQSVGSGVAIEGLMVDKPLGPIA